MSSTNPPQYGVDSPAEHGVHAGEAGATSDSTEPSHPHSVPINQFLAALGQEVRAPMARIMSTARLLLEGELAPGQDRMVGEIRDSGEILLRLISDALDYAQAEAGQLSPTTIPFDLRLLVEESMALLRKRAASRGVDFECRVHHEVPSRLMGDAGRLRQVLWNLGGCAAESTQGGPAVLRVVRVHEDRRSVTLRFAFRAYGAAESEAASGAQVGADRESAGEASITLHLAIARRLGALMGGTVVVEDEAAGFQHGWLDVTIEKQAEEPLAAAPATTHQDLVGQRVLVVDPSDAMRQSMAAKLEAWGCRLAEAAGAEDAMEMARTATQEGDPFRFVLIERELPRMSGEELGVWLRTHAGDEPLHTVLLVAAGRRGDLESARSCGFNAYLPKPIEWQELADALVEIQHLAAMPAGDERPLVTRHWLAENRRSRTRILIVEDDVVGVLVTDWTLRRMGYQVRRVSCAAEVRQLRQEDPTPFDLVILALHLPDAPGLSLIEEMRPADPRQPAPGIVALAHADTRSERAECEAAGVDAYLPRPVDLSQLCDVVERITRTDLPPGSESEDRETNAATSGKRRGAPDDRGKLAFRFNVSEAPGSTAPANGVDRPSADPAALDMAMGSVMDALGEDPPASEGQEPSSQG